MKKQRLREASAQNHLQETVSQEPFETFYFINTSGQRKVYQSGAGGTRKTFNLERVLKF
jgi:hypothetical protein